MDKRVRDRPDRSKQVDDLKLEVAELRAANDSLRVQCAENDSLREQLAALRKDTAEVVQNDVEAVFDRNFYRGDMVRHSVRQGNGKFTSELDGSWTYDGFWMNNKKHGQGTYTSADGGKYEGSWVDDMMHGHGVFCFANGRRYEGNWKDGKEDGDGVCTYADGESYQGSWKNGKKHGKGVYTYADGGCWQGSWKDDNKDGEGIYYGLESLSLEKWIIRIGLGNTDLLSTLAHYEVDTVRKVMFAPQDLLFNIICSWDESKLDLLMAEQQVLIDHQCQQFQQVYDPLNPFHRWIYEHSLHLLYVLFSLYGIESLAQLVDETDSIRYKFIEEEGLYINSETQDLLENALFELQAMRAI